jgi:hypothetical protein
MGSHGGATAEGQTALLAAKGITEAAVGAPIRSSMDTVLLGQSDGVEVYCDAIAAGADHVLVVNRIKPHTKFKGDVESGLMKMLAVGLGKHRGAAFLHRLTVARGSFPAVILPTARLMLEKLPILGGLGLVENAYGRTHTLRAFGPAELEAGEAGLLPLAKRLSPKLPCPDLDLLIVDRMGKDISGTGMDTNVTGRNRDILGEFPTGQRVRRLVVRDMSPGSDGNANGIGYADFTTDRLVRDMDMRKTVTNSLTALSPEKAAIPVHFPTDRQVVEAALDSLGLWSPDTCRVIRIRDTLALSRLLVSEALLSELPANCRVVGQPEEMAFDAGGDLPPLG